MPSTARLQPEIGLASGDLISCAFTRIGPIVSFLLIVALGGAFVLVAQTTELLASEGAHRGYLMNVSWSLTMFLVFPPVFALVALFYRRVPALVQAIATNLNLDETARQKLIEDVGAEVNRRSWTYLYFLAIPMWFAYFYGVKDTPTWLWHNFVPPGDAFWSWGTFGRITWLGYLTSTVQLVLGSSVLCLVRAISVGRVLCQHAWGSVESADPLHADGCYGLGGLRSQLHIAIGILWLLGVYIVVYHIDKIFIQGDHESSFGISAAYVLGFLAVAYFLFRLVLVPSHEVMVSVKKRALQPLSAFLEQERGKWQNSSPSSNEALEYAEVQQKYMELRPKMQEWLVLPLSGPALALGTTLNLVPPVAAIAFEVYVHLSS